MPTSMVCTAHPLHILWQYYDHIHCPVIYSRIFTKWWGMINLWFISNPWFPTHGWLKSWNNVNHALNRVRLTMVFNCPHTGKFDNTHICLPYHSWEYVPLAPQRKHSHKFGYYKFGVSIILFYLWNPLSFLNY